MTIDACRLCSVSGRSFVRATVLLSLLVGMLPLSGSAQSRTTATVLGTVTVEADSTAVVGATVEIRHEETGVTRSALTNDRGQYLILLLPPGGPYSLTISHLGFAEERQEGLVLQVGDAFRVDVGLREEAIELPGIAVEVDRVRVFDPNQVGPVTRLTERTVESMPIVSRDVMELAVLSPLVKTTESGGFSVAGQNDRYNALLVDGLASKDMFGLTSGGVPGGQAGAKLIPIDAVQQFEVLVAPFDVRLSGFTGGVMNAVTRTGTNDWRVRFGAVHRNEALTGDLSLPTGPVEASGVDRSLLTFSVGGPLVQDVFHFFVSGEFEQRSQPPNGYNLYRDDPSLIRISEEAVETVGSVLDTRFNVDPGEAGVYSLEQDLANIFARADWNLPGGDRMTVRHIFAHAGNDQAPNRTGFLPYELASNAVFRESTNHITSIQHFSEFGSRFANELGLTLQRTTDHTKPVSDLPQIEVDMVSSIDGVSYSRPVRLGGQFFAQQNDLEQTSLRLTNSLDIKVGDDVVTLGATASWYDITHAFLPGARGEYYFAGLQDLDREDNAPQRYQRTVLAEGEDEAINFDVLEWGLFLQHQLRAGKGLTMHFGLRADVPHVFGSPERNYDLEAFFGYDTSDLPSANILISPRWGWNWQSSGRRRTQVRGGMGFFAGQIPYVWLSNAFHNNGLRSVTQSCSGRWYVEPSPDWPVPSFDPAGPPASCFGSPSGSQAFQELRNVVVFDPDFRYPQDLKFSVVVDREMTDRISGSLGFLFNKALNQVGLRELNVEGTGPSLETVALAGHERTYYEPLTDDFQHVLLVTNEGEDWAASLTAELRGMVTEGLAFQLGYTLARAWDRASLVHSDMLSNFGSSPADANINKPGLTTSNFDRPHKVVASVFGSPFPGLPDTEVSILYTGQSGLPFSYVYGGDVNGDGYAGLGGSFDLYNDLVYIPDNLSEAPLSFVTQGLFESAIETDACLRQHRGRTVRRNACRAPWENRLDLRLAHTLRAGGATIRLEADLINALNMANSDWGKVERTISMVPIMDLCRYDCGERALASWGGAVLPERDEEGNLRASEPWTVVTPDSQWQMQLGARVTFGGRDQ